ncbi:MAG: SDR family NAD(P)-dependent oxidoreductase [Limimaricola sp.]|uniref:SDR family NAD(P)-dependent oxidoreductase n=1 Tax=Limimaricola sp. TaxID=2211665 RepID=UPI001DF5FEE7|nr:SDR family NAD(P)-dependent oxidoreductase [Limimaricola sp.]MBI1419017.1 SDR family NAD(P)-dependent oxidoreductase [Limimaricola sp.]
MTETWIILGATSSIARAFIRQEAANGSGFLLCGRDMDDIAATAADARLRGAPMAEAMAFDARQPDTFAPILDRAASLSGAVSVAVFVGSMPEQAAIDADPAMIAGVVTDSFTGPAQFLTAIAPMMETRGAGRVVGVGSVAGDRGRLGNYVYGASKAGFATYLSGLRNRLGRSGVHVMTVKPGPVDTAMTWGGPKQPLSTTPEVVARDIARGLAKRRNVIYTAGIWRLVMAVVRAIPEPIFKKMTF